ncbi:putative KAP P-loop domain protein [Pseudoalteromonas sp. 3J6]|uniref:KAP family P-loop NTPase fold protein n=1 Tax=Pseudoalteromonas sp. 3J6 TaxID=649161 RepID=UPI00174FD543|nr:P-loop NTPase fold protein [Pseudoalteromonas sp. 3J6]CAD2225025.1 putative KAP P-loop domain protein [Pseudoalteromonas sp. 3J6]
MDFNWDNPKPINEQVFSADNLGRAKYATYLTSLIKAKGGTDKNNLSNYVLNLDAEWGAGKTYFLKRWSEDLKGNHPVVYIDAWAIDYLESPLMTVLSEIIEQLKTQTDKIDPDETQRKLNGVIKAAAPRIGSALMKRYLGFDFNIFDSTETNEGQLTGSGKEVDFSKAGEKVLEVFCKEVTDSKESVKTLKLAIQSWVEYVVNTPIKDMKTITNSFPAFIFIDELDRCKPTYAVEMLEAIKHVFDIPGLSFIVATNTQQLAHTVKAVYGAGFNAEEYLSRFFDNKYILRTRVSKSLLENYCQLKSFSKEQLISREVILFPFVNFEKGDFYSLCNDIFNALDLSPRQSIKVLNRAESIFANVNNGKTIDVPYVMTLLSFMEKDITKYDLLIDSFISNRTLDYFNKNNPIIYSKLASVKLDISINYFNDRRLYKRIPSDQLDYESSSMQQEAPDYVYKQNTSLSEYLKVFGGLYESNSEVSNTALIKIHNKLLDSIPKQSYGEDIKLRFQLSFLIFENTLNLGDYRELAEISAHLD